MIDDIGGVTAQLVKAALDVASLRHEVIANNIANANTQGFKPKKVGFEEYLKEAALGINDQQLSIEQSDIAQILQNVMDGQTIETSGESKVELDMEMTKLSENVIRYKALLEGLGKRGDIIKMAISEQGNK